MKKPILIYMLAALVVLSCGNNQKNESDGQDSIQNPELFNDIIAHFKEKRNKIQSIEYDSISSSETLPIFDDPELARKKAKANLRGLGGNNEEKIKQNMKVYLEGYKPETKTASTHKIVGTNNMLKSTRAIETDKVIRYFALYEAFRAKLNYPFEYYQIDELRFKIGPQGNYTRTT